MSTVADKVIQHVEAIEAERPGWLRSLLFGLTHSLLGWHWLEVHWVPGSPETFYARGLWTRGQWWVSTDGKWRSVDGYYGGGRELT